MIEIKGSDVRSNTLAKPDWYIVDVVAMNPKLTKSGDSMNFNYRLKIVSDLKGNTEFEDCRVKDFLINEKGIFGVGLLFYGACDEDVRKAMDIQKKDKNAPNIPIDENFPVGKRIRALISNTTFENRVSNEATDFLPL